MTKRSNKKAIGNNNNTKNKYSILNNSSSRVTAPHNPFIKNGEIFGQNRVEERTPTAMKIDPRICSFTEQKARLDFLTDDRLSENKIRNREEAIAMQYVGQFSEKKSNQIALRNLEKIDKHSLEELANRSKQQTERYKQRKFQNFQVEKGQFPRLNSFNDKFLAGNAQSYQQVTPVRNMGLFKFNTQHRSIEKNSDAINVSFQSENIFIAPPPPPPPPVEKKIFSRQSDIKSSIIVKEQDSLQGSFSKGGLYELVSSSQEQNNKVKPNHNDQSVFSLPSNKKPYYSNKPKLIESRYKPHLPSAPQMRKQKKNIPNTSAKIRNLFQQRDFFPLSPSSVESLQIGRKIQDSGSIASSSQYNQTNHIIKSSESPHNSNQLIVTHAMDVNKIPFSNQFGGDSIDLFAHGNEGAAHLKHGSQVRILQEDIHGITQSFSSKNQRFLNKNFSSRQQSHLAHSVSQKLTSSEARKNSGGFHRNIGQDKFIRNQNNKPQMRTKSYQHLQDSGVKKLQETGGINLMNYNFIKNEQITMFPSSFKNNNNNFSSRYSHDKFMHPIRLNYGLQPYAFKHSSQQQSRNNISTKVTNQIIKNHSVSAKNLDFINTVQNSSSNYITNRFDSDFTKNRLISNHKNTSSGQTFNKNVKYPKSAGKWHNINPLSYQTNTNSLNKAIFENEYSSFTKLPHLDETSSHNNNNLLKIHTVKTNIQLNKLDSGGKISPVKVNRFPKDVFMIGKMQKPQSKVINALIKE